jgi:long-chain acyl-CoA synthetase
VEKFWLKSYPEGVPAEVDYTRYPSLVHLLEGSFRQYAEAPAFVCMDTFLTYAELDRLSRQLASYLQSCGLAKGARVALMMPNILQYPVALTAALRAGYTVVNVNPLYTARELQHQLADSGAEAIVILENFASVLQQVIARTRIKHVVVASMGDLLGPMKGTLVNLVVRHVKKMVPPYALPQAICFKDALEQGIRMMFRPAVIAPDDIAFLQYTGGTTGVPKGAMLTHRNMVANVLQTDVWLQPCLVKPPKVPRLHIVCALPLYHIFALTACALLGMRVGALNILIPNPRDIKGFVKVLAKHEFHMLPAVSTLYNALLNSPEFAKLDFSKLKISLGGGMAVQASVNERWHKLTGSVIIEGYGLSETSPVATCNPGTNTEFTGAIGLPLPSTEVTILNHQGQPVPVGERGEIAIRGPQVMAGYWHRQDETDKVMTADGFLCTGDIGIMDERGYVKIVDRKKDMILVSGFNVYPSEIEAVVSSHPGVLECACIGVPEETTGEAVKLFVVKRDPSLTLNQLQAYCKEQFTGYKKPKYIEFRSELPKSNVGKILRRALREENLAQAA